MRWSQIYTTGEALTPLRENFYTGTLHLVLAKCLLSFNFLALMTLLLLLHHGELCNYYYLFSMLSQSCWIWHVILTKLYVWFSLRSLATKLFLLNFHVSKFVIHLFSLLIVLDTLDIILLVISVMILIITKT